jgi:hypothetical protein
MLAPHQASIADLVDAENSSTLIGADPIHLALESASNPTASIILDPAHQLVSVVCVVSLAPSVSPPNTHLEGDSWGSSVPGSLAMLPSSSATPLAPTPHDPVTLAHEILPTP